ncbi:MAG: efflux RND transporter permease subunit [Blautia sp.]
MLVKMGKWIAKHKILICILGFLLIIPSILGIIKTRINYDLLSYLPDTLETVSGQDILVDEFGMGAFSMVVVEDMEMKDVQKLEEKFSEVEHVKDVLWYDDVADITLPVDMIPENLKKSFFNGNATMMLVCLTTPSSTCHGATKCVRSPISSALSVMTGIVTDIDLCMQAAVYVAIAAVLALIVLEITGTSLVVPFIFLLCIGISILYNMGSNVFLGEISYVTEALVAVLQLGVTMDYSIFLLDSYEENKKRFPDDRNRAMGHAIANTFKSITGSSVTTVAGFAALCMMTFALGKNLGIVMSKGVIIGVFCCVTMLPAMSLIFDRPIEKTRHKSLFKSEKVDRVSAFITRHYKLWLVIFCVLLLPGIYGNNHTGIYYNIAKSLPSDLDSNVANEKLNETFDMSVMHIIMMDKDMDATEKTRMLEEVKKVDGVKWTIGINTLLGASVPDSMIPDNLKSMLQGDRYELAFVSSKYESATDEVNAQIAKISDIVKKYDSNGMVIGEAPLMKDLQDVTDIDLQNVNIASIAAIFAIILIIFKSISLPVILVAVIEFAIVLNMAVPLSGISFLLQALLWYHPAGSYRDYVYDHYQKERQRGLSKKEAVAIAHKTSMLSIVTSGCSFFACTFGISVYSRVDMIGSICTLLSRGALISMLVVIFILPAMFMLFDKLIVKTSIGFLGKKKKAAN